MSKAVWEVDRPRVSDTPVASAIQYLESLDLGDMVMLHQNVHTFPEDMRFSANNILNSIFTDAVEQLDSSFCKVIEKL